jgi:bisphosphoglycerate-dependent phosphoglycerate mutase
MEYALHRFPTFKDVILLRPGTKKAKAKGKALRTELVKKRKVDEETNAETSTPSKKRYKMNGGRDYISHEIDISMEFNADFNFLKMNLISHWAEQVRLYGALQQYSANRHEQPLETNLKDGWNASHRNVNYQPQVITFQRRIHKLRNQRAQSASPRSASGDQRLHLESAPFRCKSGCHPEPPVIGEARIHGTPNPPRRKAS